MPKPPPMWALLLALLASASCYNVPSKTGLDAAFTNWHKQQNSAALMQKQVNRLAHPDVKLWLVFQGSAQPAVLPGSATTAALHRAAARLHNLDPHQQLRFVLNGMTLPPGRPISETALANSRNLEVFVMSGEAVAVRRGPDSSGGSAWWSGAGAASGHRCTSVSRVQRARHAEAHLTALAEEKSNLGDRRKLEIEIRKAEARGASDEVVAQTREKLEEAQKEAEVNERLNFFLEEAMKGSGTMTKKAR